MAELIPAWDKGSLLPLDKIEVHRRGLRHMAVSVFIQRGGQTLLQRRALGNTTRRGFGRMPAAPIRTGRSPPPPAPPAVWGRNWACMG